MDVSKDIFRFCRVSNPCTKCRLRGTDKIKLTDSNHTTNSSGVTFELFRDMVERFQGKVTSRQTAYARDILRPDEYILSCSYPGKMGILFYNSGFGKNYGTTLMSTNFGRLFQFDLYGSEEQWSLSLLENPWIPDESMVHPVSDEYLGILSIMTYRRETKNTASYDTDLFYKLVSEYYHQHQLMMGSGDTMMVEDPLVSSEGCSPFDVVDLSDKDVILEEVETKTHTKQKDKPKKTKKTWGLW